VPTAPLSSSKLRLAIAYFGIPRSLDYTLGSIESNVISPIPSVIQFKRFGVFSKERLIQHPETGENVVLDPSDAKLLNLDSLEEIEPWEEGHQSVFEAVRPFGDAWQNNHYSTQNLIKQLHTLKTVTLKILSEGYETCVFARPDLQYLDSMAPLYSHLLKKSAAPTCVLPDWGSAGGLNDTFALCIGRTSISSYGCRLDRVIEYCTRSDKPLHAERLLKHALVAGDVKVKRTKVRALRVRATGETAHQDFRPDWLRRMLGN
jgi:hypothetical protein